MSETQIVPEYLLSNIPHHTDMIEPIRRGTATILMADAHGVLLRETVSGAYLLTAKTPRDAARFMEHIRNPRLMAVHQAFAADEAARRFGLTATLQCYQAVWPHTTPPQASPAPFHVSALPESMAEVVSALYSHNIGLEYIQGRLLAGEMFGAFAGRELAGFIGLHEEGSMGMLEVLPAFRRRGVGALLVSFLCDRLIQRGLTPFSQFSTENEASRKLHERLGFSISEDCVHWLES